MIQNIDYQKKSVRSPKHPTSHTPRFRSGGVCSRAIREMMIRWVWTIFLMGSARYRTGATECPGSLIFVWGNFLCKNELCPGHFEN